VARYRITLAALAGAIHSGIMKIALFILIATCFVWAQSGWSARNATGIELAKQSRYADAETAFRAAMSEAEQFPESDPRRSTTLLNLALVREQQGAFAEAEGLDRRALSLREKNLAANDPLIADTLGNLGGLLRATGRDSEAYPMLRRALEIDEAAGDEARTARILNDLGLTLMQMHEAARAEPVLRRSRALMEKAKGAESIEAAWVTDSIATLEHSQHEDAKAEAELRRALPVFERQFGEQSPAVAAILSNLSVAVRSQKRAVEAAEFLRRAVAMLDKGPLDNSGALRIRANQAGFEADAGNFAEARRLYEEVIAGEERIYGSGSAQVAGTLKEYSAVLKGMHRKSEARAAEARASGILKTFR
jgi:tetratricopeptide (TPR) repeat protein